MGHLKHFPHAVLAGFCIGLGGYIFLRLKDAFTGGNVVGALLFTIGLLMVCSRGYNLYTGKVCYLFDNKPSYLIDLAVIWVGNLVGCMFLSGLIHLTSVVGVDAGVNITAQGMINAKMASSYGSLFVLGVLCNIFIYLAVDNFKKNPHEVGKYISLFLGVMGFILCGTEHCVADMFYWTVSGVFYSDFGPSILCIIVISLGNSVGGLVFPVIEKWHAKANA